MSHRNTGLDLWKRLGHERRKAMLEFRIASAKEAGKHCHTRSKVDRELANRQIADYLRRVPVPPTY